MILVFIALGSNLNSPQNQLLIAIEELKKLPETAVIKVSSFYQSAPMGPQNQPDFINCVVSLTTELNPWQLLEALQKLEQKQGRIRKERWGARIIDLDILLYGNETIQTPTLTIPHVGIKERAFVLYPLAEIAPNLLFPTGEDIATLLSRCSPNNLYP